jgi:hypothetical protein
MTSRSVSLFVAVLMSGALLSACAGPQGEPFGSRHEIEQRFRRPFGSNVLGLRVSDALKSGSLSSEQVEQISLRLAKMLGESGQFEGVIDLTGQADDGGVNMILNVSVTEFHDASEQEISQGVRSRLVGHVTLVDGRKDNRGAAMVEADGRRLDVTGNRSMPDTLKFFAAELLQLVH